MHHLEQWLGDINGRKGFVDSNIANRLAWQIRLISNRSDNISWPCPITFANAQEESGHGVLHWLLLPTRPGGVSWRSSFTHPGRLILWGFSYRCLCKHHRG